MCALWDDFVPIVGPGPKPKPKMDGPLQETLLARGYSKSNRGVVRHLVPDAITP